MSSPISPGSNSNLLDDQPSSPTTNTNNPESSTTLSSNPNSPPRPQIPPGHLGPIRSHHPHDVLSGRGGRINSHPGNVHFREMVDSYKRDYLDPRTKKVEKARIAAKIVATVRSLEPNGRFLKEDPHTGCWVEIGDERAWKKAGQALRESAPEIRAEREKMLRGLAGGDVVADKLPVSTSKSTPSKKVQQQQSQQRQADPPGPRHRPNPPAREGLGRLNSSRSYSDNNEPELAVRSKKQTSEGDAELERMRQEYYQMQRMQAEQQRRMEQYQAQLAAAGALDGTIANNTATAATTSAEYDRDVYNEYTKMQAGIMMNSGYCQQVSGNHHHPMGGVPQGGNSKQRFSNQDIAAAVLDSGLLPANSGFDMPVVRGEQQIGSAAQLGLPGGGQQYHQQQFANHPQQQYGGGQNYQGVRHQDQEVDAFANQHFNSCDKTVSTMSSFDVQSMDMSSLGGFSWNQSGYNMSGLISTGSRNDTGNGFNNASQQRSSPNKKSKKKSSLERKLEKVNEQHRRQQMQEMQHKQQQSQMMMQGGGVQGGPIDVPTAGGASWHQQQQVPTSNPTTNRSRKYSQEHNNMASLNSFGFEAIEEDDITEASYKMSNLGLSGMSGMDMTFASDILSIRSKSVPKMRDGDDTNKKEKDGKNRRTSSSNEEHLKRSGSDGDENQFSPPLVVGTNHGFGFGEANGGTNNKPAAEVGVSSVLFNQSLSSTSNTSGGSSSMSMKVKGPPNMEDFNESFKSMEMEDSRSKGSGGSGGGGRGGKPPQARRLPDPDGVVGGNHRLANSSAGRRKDPSGGRLGTIHSSRGRPKQRGAVSSSHAAASANNAARLPYSSSSNTNNNHRGSNSSLGISDPDMMLQSGLGLSSNNNMDFGVSLDSLKSFNQSAQSGESWLNQYNSVENIGTDRNPWDDEDAERHGTGSSAGSSMSEISAPRMVTTGGGD